MSPKNPPKERIDVLLVAKGLAESREQAKRLILAGAVEIHGISTPKPGQLIDVSLPILLKAKEKYVSRGGLKLERALADFAISLEDVVCADVGASTGGFTDCMLQHGAARVFAIDVGATQMHERVRNDSRVTLLEHTNARELSPDMMDDTPGFAAVDVSFISVTRISLPLHQCMKPDGAAVVLIKPQFEAGRTAVSKGRGVIKDKGVHREVLEEVLSALATHGWYIAGLIPSPIAGGSGNREFLCYLKVGNSEDPFAWKSRIAIDDVL